MNKKSIAIGADPNATDFKNELIKYIEELGYNYKDFGSEDPIYANTAVKVCNSIINKEYDCGILICGTGIGVSIAANKVKGIYAALVNDVYQAERAIKSNNANVLALGAQVVGIESAKIFVKIFLENSFDVNSRSFPKVEAIKKYEENN